jgi:Xaa-Pro aminopeptidase
MTATVGLEGELGRRHAALLAGIDAIGADALAGAREGVVTYLTGYTTSTWSNHSRPIVAVLSRGGLDVVCAETEADAVRERVPGVRVHPYVDLRPPDGLPGLPDGALQFSPHAVEVLRAAIEARGVELLAVDALGAHHPPASRVAELALPGGVRTVDGSAVLWRERLAKSAWEVERMRDAAAVLARALDRLRDRLQPGLTERAIHQALCAASFEEGAHGIGYANVVAGVDRGLFGAPTERRFEAGDVLFVDGGLLVDGYWADFCRMYSIGAPTTAQRDDYARTREALDAAAALAPLTTAGQVGEAIGAALGLPPGAVGFGRFGHGIGLYMPEPPSLHADDATPLREGTVLCIEPAYLGATGNYVVEEEHVVRAGRFERISPAAPRGLIEI